MDGHIPPSLNLNKFLPLLSINLFMRQLPVICPVTGTNSPYISRLIKKSPTTSETVDESIVLMKLWWWRLPHQYLLILSVYSVLERCRCVWGDSASCQKRPPLDCWNLLQRLPPGQPDTALLWSSLFWCPGRGYNYHKGSRQFVCWQRPSSCLRIPEPNWKSSNWMLKH